MKDYINVLKLYFDFFKDIFMLVHHLYNIKDTTSKNRYSHNFEHKNMTITIVII